MANFAPPISRDGFIYHGQLFADVGNLNRHPRASEAEIVALLRPKSSKVTSQKDQVGHYYIAQLKHYGLPPTKDKNAAKVRLLNALNEGKLKVPQDVKKLETALKKEYDVANRNARAELKGKGPASEVETSTPAKKRKRDDENTATNGPSLSASKKAKTPVTKPGPSKAKATKSQPAPSRNQNSASEATPKRTTTASKAKKATPKAGSTSKKGIYYVTVPTIKETWPTHAATPKSLKIILCPDGETLWGSYDLGPFSGVLLFDSDPKEDDIGFVWRGTDTSESDKIKFTTSIGYVRFPENNRITGTFYNLYGYRCEFEGKVQAGPRTCPRDIASFENEWEDYGTTNNWFGRPPVRIPNGERPPNRNFARSPALAARKSAEPRYLPEDSPQVSSSDSSGKQTPTKSKQTSTKSKQPREKSSTAPNQETPTNRPVNGSAKRASVIKHEGDFYNASPSAIPSTYDPTDIDQITGVYDIQCPSVEDNWLDSQNNLRLLICRDGRASRTWGSFAWGPFFGIIQMNPGPADYSEQSVSLGWRARDGENGSVRFGRGCNGTVEFPEPSIIQGRLFGLYGDVMEFWGRKRPGPKNCGHAPKQFEEEWNSFPSEVYGDKGGSEGDAELYDRYGNLNPRGRYSALLERSLRG